jgi:hypothetical protein
VRIQFFYFFFCHETADTFIFVFVFHERIKLSSQLVSFTLCSIHSIHIGAGHTSNRVSYIFRYIQFLLGFSLRNGFNCPSVYSSQLTRNPAANSFSLSKFLELALCVSPDSDVCVVNFNWQQLGKSNKNFKKKIKGCFSSLYSIHMKVSRLRPGDALARDRIDIQLYTPTCDINTQQHV